MFIKKTFKELKKVERVRNYALKCNLYLCFLIQEKFLISGAKMLMSAELKECVAVFMCFIYLL